MNKEQLKEQLKELVYEWQYTYLNNVGLFYEFTGYYTDKEAVELSQGIKVYTKFEPPKKIRK